MFLKTLIDIKNLTKIYRLGSERVSALDNVNIKVGSGELVGVVGCSGSGKSTLMNIIGCLDKPNSGEYFFDGKEVNRLSERHLSEIRGRKIGFVFQSFNLIPSLSALENVELPLAYRGINKRKRYGLAAEALEKVGLGNRLKHRPSELSGGQQQRVAIARAIVGSPPLILADEPTGNLDSTAGAQIIEIIRELNASGKTIIIVTHDNALANSFPRKILIKDGRVIE